MDKKIALISGITGQDGSFLAEFLIEKGYEVHGILRRSSSFNTGRIEHLYLDEWVRDMKKNRLVNLHYGDMTDSSSLIRIIQQVQPDEIYNLAAQSHVKVSFDVPEYTAEADAVGTLRMLEAVRILGLEKKTKIYQASTSELFGLVQEVPQKETTPFYQSVWCGQAIRLLDYEELPGKLRHVRRKRHSLQPRKRTARRNLRDTQNYTGSCTYSPRVSGQVISG